MNSDIDSVSSSGELSSDDDDYLLSSVRGEDREAIIRRKLLESFYGTTTDTASAVANQPSDPVVQQGTEDLDASNFSASTYAKRRIHTNSTSELLSCTNELSHSIRLLDSTMQTLVYENYSKFISATDAIRSIGQSVHVSHEKLQTLQNKIDKVEQDALTLENNLSEKRKEVVEKLKLQRLLNRLKSLVELPNTLKDMHKNQKYHSMAKDYVDAMTIFNQHSGFESLENIQVECKSIMNNMIREVGKMIYLWCGGLGGGTARSKRVNKFSVKSGIPATLEKIWLSSGRFAKIGYEVHISTPDDVGSVFECIRALFLYKKYCFDGPHDFIEEGEEKVSDSESNDAVSILADHADQDFLILALESCTKLLEQVLEDHEMEVHEIVTSGNVITLCPQKYLLSLLEAATLVGNTFGNDDSQRAILTEYVSLIWFPDFVAHVKDMIDRFSNITFPIAKDGMDLEISDDEYKTFSEISLDMMNLVRSVREIANGLVLPEIGLNVEVASGLVEEAVAITESLVRTRVTTKFHQLRHRVFRECLLPFVHSIFSEISVDDHRQYIMKSVEKANAKLSEIMQMIDGSIRSIFLNENSEGVENDSLSFDPIMVNQAVTFNCRGFIFWLASILETIAGCELSTSRRIFDVKPFHSEALDDIRNPKRNSVYQIVELRKEQDEHDWISDAERQVLHALKEELDGSDRWETRDCLQLVLIQMCRLCERNLIVNMNQSISSSLLDSPVTQNDFMYRSINTDAKIDSDGVLSSRLLLAASRSLSVYVSIKGHDATSCACQDLQSSCLVESGFFPHCPSDAAVKILEIAKQICFECNLAFGTELKASDIPDFGSDYRYDSMSLSSASRFSTSHSTVKGLSLDVARIFTQKVQIYPSQYDLVDFTRDSILSSALHIGIKAWSEIIRTCSLTAYAYRQIQVDEEFLRYMLPHYLSEDSVNDVSKILDELMVNAGERCTSSRCIGVKEYFDEVRSKLSSPLTIALGWLKEEDAAGGRGALQQFVLREE